MTNIIHNKTQPPMLPPMMEDLFEEADPCSEMNSKSAVAHFMWIPYGEAFPSHIYVSIGDVMFTLYIRV